MQLLFQTLSITIQPQNNAKRFESCINFGYGVQIVKKKFAIVESIMAIV